MKKLVKMVLGAWPVLRSICVGGCFMLCVGVPSAAFAYEISPKTETWSTSVNVGRGAEHTFWITGLSPDTDIYWFEAKASYKDATGNEAWLEVSKSVTVEDDEGIITGMYLLLTAEDWAGITKSMLSFAITVYGFYDEDAPSADRKFTFGHAAGRDKFPLEGSDKSRLKLTLGEQLVFSTSSKLVVSNHIVSVPGPVALHAMEKAVFTPSAEVAAMFGGDEEAKAEYCAKFGFAVVPTSDGQWAVVAGLKPEAWSNVVESAQAATRQIPVADLAALELGVPTDVTVEGCVPGFYYSFYSGSTVTNVGAIVDERGRNVLCGSEGDVKFSGVTKPSDAAGFFTIGVLEFPGVEWSDEVGPLATRMRMTNKELEDLGNLLSKFSKLQAEYSQSDSTQTKSISLSESEVALLKSCGYADAKQQMSLTRADTEMIVQLIKTRMDALNNGSQTRMTRMNGLVEKRDGAFTR